MTEHDHVLLIDQNEPTTYQETITGLESEKWLEAMRFEMESMHENQVWTLVDRSERIKPIGCKWIYKKKLTWMVMCIPIRGD